ncbi:MAG TPA: hypothetical protein VEE82_03050, partial [Thermodesulfovibrionales bacterium]|nr:hypothetical protein [Thermodesulfovibrionales bacterium]
LDQATLYPGLALVEGSNVSVGRGTQTPFELLGAPWMNGKELAAHLNKRNISGVRFIPADFVPSSDRYRKIKCHGVRIVMIDRDELDAPALGIEIISALHRLYPRYFQLEKTFPLIASRGVFDSIRDHRDPVSIAMQWQDGLEEFRKIREKYLLY